MYNTQQPGCYVGVLVCPGRSHITEKAAEDCVNVCVSSPQLAKVELAMLAVPVPVAAPMLVVVRLAVHCV